MTIARAPRILFGLGRPLRGAAAALALCLAIAGTAGAVELKKVREFPVSSEGLSETDVNPLMRVGDLTGDGKVDFVFFNGTKYLKAYDHEGALLWSHLNPNGVPDADLYHPWIPVVYDVDHDGRAEVIAFRTHGPNPKSHPYLALLDGPTGKVRKEVELWFEPSIGSHGRRGMCAVAHMRSRETAEILVTGHDYTTEVRAFDHNLNLLWERPLAEEYRDGGGHYLWAYDLNGDGLHELCAGKFVLNARGEVVTTLMAPGVRDHVDALVCADLDPARPGVEIVCIGQTGTTMWSIDPKTLQATRVWTTKQVRNPQFIVLGNVDRQNPGPELLISERGSEKDAAVYCVKADGTILHSLGARAPYPSITMDLDGDRGEDEVVCWSGILMDGRGKRLADASWFDAQAATAKVTAARTLWCINPFAYDVLGDAREEMLLWSKTRLAIAQDVTPLAGPPASLRNDRDYRLRAANLYLNRSALYFAYPGEGKRP